MKGLLSKRVRWAWFLVVLALCAAGAVLWQLWTGGPPTNSVLITSAEDTEATGAAATQVNRGLATPRQSTIDSKLISTSPTALSPSADNTREPSALASATPHAIVVYVSGAVQKPGVYTLPIGSRIGDALDTAGGATGEANLDGINLAERLADEEHVLVPRIGDPFTPVVAGLPSNATARNSAKQSASSTPRAESPPIGKININKATAEDLESLPGIGPTLAEKIIEYRAANGAFRTTEELMQVPGIKEGVFSKVRDYVTVSP